MKISLIHCRLFFHVPFWFYRQKGTFLFIRISHCLKISKSIFNSVSEFPKIPSYCLCAFEGNRNLGLQTVFKKRMQSMNEIKGEKYLSFYTCPDCGHMYHQFRLDKTIIPCPNCHRRKWDVKDDHPDIVFGENK